MIFPKLNEESDPERSPIMLSVFFTSLFLLSILAITITINVEFLVYFYLHLVDEHFVDDGGDRKK